MKKEFCLLLLFFTSVYPLYNPFIKTVQHEPKVVVVLVLDQFPFYYLTRHQSNFKYNGFKRFIDQGILYTNAVHAHGIPETSPGHTSLSTGVLPVSHGVASNRWFDHGKAVEFSQDSREDARVISAPAQTIGRSPCHVDVDSLSDQVNMHRATQATYKVYSVGIKETSTIATAGQKNPGFWFNRYQGGFTTSHHYMRELPDWVKKFNERSGVRQLKKVAWPLSFKRTNPAYDYPFIDNYTHASYTFKLAGRTDIEIDYSKPEPYEFYMKTPAATKLLLNFAECCIKNAYKNTKHEKLLLWVCLSSLDLVGHYYGPDSLEVIDFIYHLDQQIDTFITKMERTVGSSKIQFVLVADHGVQPMQEISKLRGIKHAKRIMSDELMKSINDTIMQDYGVNNLLSKFESTYFIYDENSIAELEKKGTRTDAEERIKKLLLERPGIKNVWTSKELENSECAADSHTQFYKNHLFENRLGDIIVQPEPYCLITNYAKGCSHNTPYEYDIHIPLAFYQKGMTPQHIKKRVWATQLAPTIAQLLKVQAPAASLMEPLPHLLTEEKV